MTEAARLVDELTTLLYTPFGTYRGRPRVACGACAKQADKPESVVHESDCPVYRLIHAEAANTAVIRANAEEIADLEDTRDDLEAKVNDLTAEMECRNELAANNARLRALLAERDAEVARLLAAAEPVMAYLLTTAESARWSGTSIDKGHQPDDRLSSVNDVLLRRSDIERLRAALAAAGGEGTAT